MKNENPIIDIQDLHHAFGRTEAVNGLNLKIPRGRCYGFFGRNGAGKTTTIKCLLNLLRPSKGSIRLFGLDPAKEEIATKSRLSYVPDHVSVYPWMTSTDYFDYLASFREHWNRNLQQELMERFDLDPQQKARTFSKGQRVQMALIAALCPEPELLVLDEPTSGLDPLIRKEFIEVVIGAYQESDPENRTVFVSTHLITEFEGLIDEFTILEKGSAVFNAVTDTAREQFRRVRARFPEAAPALDHPTVVEQTQDGRELIATLSGSPEPVIEKLQAFQPEDLVTEALTLEEIFLLVAKHHAALSSNGN